MADCPLADCPWTEKGAPTGMTLFTHLPSHRPIDWINEVSRLRDENEHLAAALAGGMEPAEAKLAEMETLANRWPGLHSEKILAIITGDAPSRTVAEDPSSLLTAAEALQSRYDSTGDIGDRHALRVALEHVQSALRLLGGVP